MPDLAITPSAKYGHEPVEPGYMVRAAKYSKQFHQVLTAGIEATRQRYPQAKIMSFNTMAFTDEQLPLLQAEGFNITDSCIPMPLTTQPGTELCTTPDKYLFWDSNHLTAVANRKLGEAWYKAIVFKP
jgi:phospholipase/lecithinase/hemolysin